MDLVRAFFHAQDAAQAGREEEADELFATISDAADDVDGSGGGEHPPPSVVKSMALNARAEIALDRALASGFPLQPSSEAAEQQREAIRLLQAAIRACPLNATAMMNRALLARDLRSGDGAGARVAHARRNMALFLIAHAFDHIGIEREGFPRDENLHRQSYT